MKCQVAKLLAISPPYVDPVVFAVPSGGYSMPTAVQLLERLEQVESCVISETSWKGPSYGNLVEVGVPVRRGTIEFTVMSSYEHILIYRKSGNKARFFELCDLVRDMEF